MDPYPGRLCATVRVGALRLEIRDGAGARVGRAQRELAAGPGARRVRQHQRAGVPARLAARLRPLGAGGRAGLVVSGRAADLPQDRELDGNAEREPRRRRPGHGQRTQDVVARCGGVHRGGDRLRHPAASRHQRRLDRGRGPRPDERVGRLPAQHGARLSGASAQAGESAGADGGHRPAIARRERSCRRLRGGRTGRRSSSARAARWCCRPARS